METIQDEGIIQHTDELENQPKEEINEPFLEPKEEKIEKSKSIFCNKTIWLVLIFINLYCFSDLVLPLYNKLLFKGFGSLKGFHFPITTSFLQVFSVGVILFVYLLIEKAFKTIRKVNHEDPWLFTNFFKKLKYLLPVSILFAGVITLSNIGLDKIALNVHVLLRTTTIFWIIAFSFMLQSESPNFQSILFALIVAIGAIFLSIDLGLGWEVNENSISIIINLASSFCSGAMAIALRYVCTQTDDLKMSLIEITMLKMIISSFFILIPSIVIEMIIQRPNFWQGITEQWQMSFVIILGVLFTLLYQFSVVAVTSYTKAISIGVLHQFLVLPQLAIYSLLNLFNIVPSSWGIQSFTGTYTEILGSIAIIIGVTGYGIVKFIENYKKQKQEEQSSLEIELQTVNTNL